MRRLLKWLVILGVLAGVGTAIAIPTRSWLQKRSLPSYLTAKVSRGRVETMVSSTGTIKPVHSVSVGSFVSGPILEVKVDFNSVVKKDDVLALIDPRLLSATYDRDLANLETQKAEKERVEALLQQASNNYRRACDLREIKEDYISDMEMDQYKFTAKTYEAQLKLARAAISQAEATLKNSKANLGYTEIRSPVDGIVIERKVDPGQTVASSFQTPELFIIAPDMEKKMHVFANVDEADIGMIRSAQEHEQTVKFTVDAYPSDLFEGKIYQIRKSSTTTQNVVTYPVVIEAPNPDMKLMPGMTANISFQIEAREDALRVPASALRFVPAPAQIHPEDRHHVEVLSRRPEVGQRSAEEKTEQAKKRTRRIVWIQDGELLRAVPVTLGLIENRFAEVLSGDLKPGQEIVVGTKTGPGR